MQLYLVDSFQYAASVSAATAVFRSFLGFVFPLFGQDMNDDLGIGPANSLLGGACIRLKYIRLGANTTISSRRNCSGHSIPSVHLLQRREDASTKQVHRAFSQTIA